MAQAEIWAYQINSKDVSDCNKRPEVNIDEVWESIEKATRVQFDIARDSAVIPG